MTEKTLKAIGYCRVSTEEQAREGVSLDAQAENIRRYCELYDLKMVDVLIDEGRSGKDMDRPAMNELMARVEQGAVDAVVFYKLDRVGRSTIDLLSFAEVLRASGVALHSVTEKLDTGSAHGSFFFTLLAALAEMERRQIAERTKAALAHKQDRGEWVGRPPAGYYTKSGRLVALDPSLTTKAKRLRREGKSFRAIAESLSVSVGTAHSLVNTNGKTRKAKYAKVI